jgi:hypothetical protein
MEIRKSEKVPMKICPNCHQLRKYFVGDICIICAYPERFKEIKSKTGEYENFEMR